MASFAAKLVAKKVFKESAANKGGQEDPYFETVPATRLGFKSKKKLPKALPPGLTANEEKVLVKAKRRAYKIDMALGSFLGTKIGVGAVIGLVPGIGDVADMLLALMVYRTICSIEPELDSGTKMKMKFNIVIDFLIGLIPFVGDIADAVYKCNTKNVIILERELRKRGEKRLRGTPHANDRDPSLADEFDYEADENDWRHQYPPARDTSQRESRRDRDGRDRKDRNDRDRRDRRDPRDRDLEVGREEVSPPRSARTR